MAKKEIERRIYHPHGPSVLIVIKDWGDDSLFTLQFGKIVQQITHVARTDVLGPVMIFLDLFFKFLASDSLYDLIKWKA